MNIGFPAGLCVKCKGARMLCGRRECPLLMKYYAGLKVEKVVSTRELQGASPPSVFVGRHGYPRVYAGPMISPLAEGVGKLDSPESWASLPLQEIVRMRFSLVRTEARANVKKPGRITEVVQETVLSRAPPDAEAELEKEPRLSLDPGSEVMSPAARARRVSVYGIKTDHRIEKIWSDTDLRARDALVSLYEKGVPVSRVSQVLSAGMLGLGKKRKMVPTRWSITASDSMISEELMKRTREYPPVNQILVFSGSQYDNNYVIVFFPEGVGFEMLEAWSGKSVWNPAAGLVIAGAREDRKGLREYPEIGGSYFAARLAVYEKLCRIRRSAGVLVLRHIGPGYTVPVGVWQVREGVRKVLSGDPEKVSGLRALKNVITERSPVRFEAWFNNSMILKEQVTQPRLTKWLS